MKKIIIILVFILTGAVILLSCKDDSSKLSQPVALTGIPDQKNLSADESPENLPADTIDIKGTIVFKDIEGGFYAIDGDNGDKYDPVNLPEEYKKNGLKVKVKARFNKDIMSIHMYGEIVDIVSIVSR